MDWAGMRMKLGCKGLNGEKGYQGNFRVGVWCFGIRRGGVIAYWD